MRYVVPFLLILASCGLGAMPWEYVDPDTNTYVHFAYDDCARWGAATVEKTPSGTVFIHVRRKGDLQNNCDMTLTDAVMYGLRQRGGVWPPDELRVLDADLWEPTKAAVENLNLDPEEPNSWPAPVRHVD